MPKSKFRRRRRRKKTWKKSKKMRKMRIPMPLGGFGMSKTVRLRLVYQGKLDPGSNSYAFETWTLNNLEKPKTTTALIGAPGNYSVFAAQYLKYTVLGAKVKLSWIPSGTETVQWAESPGYLGLYIGYEDTEFADVVGTSVNHLLEQPNRTNSTFRRLQYSNNTGMTLTHKVSARKFFKIPKAGLYINEDDFSGETGSTLTPRRNIYCFPYVTNIQGNNPAGIHFRMIIDYVVRFSELKPNRAN